MMTDPAPAIRDEIRHLIEAQIQTFGQPASLTPSELTECHYRAERFWRSDQVLDQAA